jgi:hypothetical protein
MTTVALMSYSDQNGVLSNCLIMKAGIISDIWEMLVQRVSMYNLTVNNFPGTGSKAYYYYYYYSLQCRGKMIYHPCLLYIIFISQNLKPEKKITLRAMHIYDKVLVVGSNMSKCILSNPYIWADHLTTSFFNLIMHVRTACGPLYPGLALLILIFLIYNWVFSPFQRTVGRRSWDDHN